MYHGARLVVHLSLTLPFLPLAYTTGLGYQFSGFCGLHSNGFITYFRCDQTQKSPLHEDWGEVPQRETALYSSIATLHVALQLTRLLIAKVASRLGSHTPFYRLYIVGSGHANIIAFGALPGGLFG